MRRTSQLLEAEVPEETYTNAQILDEFLTVPDDHWSTTLVEHPSLAGVLRSEIQRLLRERRALLDVLLDLQAALNSKGERP